MKERSLILCLIINKLLDLRVWFVLNTTNFDHIKNMTHCVPCIYMTPILSLIN